LRTKGPADGVQTARHGPAALAAAGWRRPPAAGPCRCEVGAIVVVSCCAFDASDLDRNRASLTVPTLLLRCNARAAIPDICAVLESSDGYTSKEDYKAWYRQWLYPQYPALLEDDIYAMLNGEKCPKIIRSFAEYRQYEKDLNATKSRDGTRRYRRRVRDSGHWQAD
jgi:hypothetical protein